MPLISKKELEELYWGEPGTEMGSTIIGDMIGCSDTTVLRYLDEYDIPKRKPTVVSNECMTEKSIDTSTSKYKELVKNGNIELKKEEFHHKSKIDKELGIKIYKEYDNLNIVELSKKYHISQNTVHVIVKGNHWTTKGLPEKSINLEKHEQTIDKRIALQIYEDYKIEQIIQEELAKRYNTSKDTVGKIVRAEHWATKDKEPIKKLYRTNIKVSKEKGIEIYNEYHNADKTYEFLAKKYNLNKNTIGKIVRAEHWTTNLKEEVS